MATQKNPLFAGDNLLEQGTLAASSEATDFQKEKAIDGFAFDAWKPSAVGNATLDVALSAAKQADYLGIFAHDFPTTKTRAQLLYGDGTVFFPASKALTFPATTRPLFDSFAKLVENLLHWSEDFDNAKWLKSGTATVTADTDLGVTLVNNADTLNLPAVNDRVFQPTTDDLTAASQNQAYTFSIWLEGTGTMTLRMTNGVDDTIDKQITLVTGTLTRFFSTVTFNATPGNVETSIRRQSGDATSCVAWGAQLQKGSVAAPTYQRTAAQQTLSTGAKDWRVKFYGRQNIALQSEAFNASEWTKRGAVVVTADDTTAPDGTLTADKIENIGSSGVDDLFDLVAATTGVRYEPSWWIKKITATGQIRFGNPQSLNHGRWHIDLALLSNDWERITRDHVAVTIVSEFDGTGSMCGLHWMEQVAGPYDFWLWGAQLEEAPITGDYVKTTTVKIEDIPGEVGAASFGLAIESDSGIATGNPFFPHAVSDEFITTISQSGQPLGHSLRRTGVAFSVNIKTVNIKWVRDNWKNLITALQSKPIFFAWDPDNHPEETVWAWLDKRKPGPPTFISPLHHNFTIALVGLIE